MDTKKLEKWAELLLDTGKRNNLINFKDTKSSTVEVLLPEPSVLFEKIEETTSFNVFDPKIIEYDYGDYISEPEQLLQKSSGVALTKKQVFLDRYSSRVKRQNQILVYSTSGNPISTLKNIEKKSREFLEERGVNVAYMAFGFVNWKENDTSNIFFHAPLLLVPIQLSQTSAVSSYTISPTEDDIVTNVTFAYKLNAEYGIKLPDYNDESLNEYLEKVRVIVEKLHWTVSTECKIGLFSFLKLNMYRDLKDNIADILANENVRRLLGEPLNSGALIDLKEADSVIDDPLIELHSVVDADSSQIEAIEMAKSGKSFVLQGPPGTGKSQTITNIIAECLSDGKKVLFVSEKLAALNVISIL